MTTGIQYESRGVNRTPTRSWIPFVAVFVVGLAVGAILHREITKTRRPPVRVSLSVDLVSNDFSSGPDMVRYARAIAAQLEGRFYEPHSTLYFPDLQVTALAATCFEHRPGCGSTVPWGIQIRTKHQLDPRVIGVAVGRGDLTVRPVQAASQAACPQQQHAEDAASIIEPFVPMSFSSDPCLRLGPVVRRFVGTTAQAHTELSSTVPSTVDITPSSLDDTWLGEWSQTKTNEDIAIVLDGWVLARVSHQAIADAYHGEISVRRFGITKPILLTSIGVHTPMDGAIALAINSATESTPSFTTP